MPFLRQSPLPLLRLNAPLHHSVQSAAPARLPLAPAHCFRWRLRRTSQHVHADIHTFWTCTEHATRLALKQCHCGDEDIGSTALHASSWFSQAHMSKQQVGSHQVVNEAEDVISIKIKHHAHLCIFLSLGCLHCSLDRCNTGQPALTRLCAPHSMTISKQSRRQCTICEGRTSFQQLCSAGYLQLLLKLCLILLKGVLCFQQLPFESFHLHKQKCTDHDRARLRGFKQAWGVLHHQQLHTCPPTVILKPRQSQTCLTHRASAKKALALKKHCQGPAAPVWMQTWLSRAFLCSSLQSMFCLSAARDPASSASRVASLRSESASSCCRFIFSACAH